MFIQGAQRAERGARGLLFSRGKEPEAKIPDSTSSFPFLVLLLANQLNPLNSRALPLSDFGDFRNLSLKKKTVK